MCAEACVCVGFSCPLRLPCCLTYSQLCIVSEWPPWLWDAWAVHTAKVSLRCPARLPRWEGLWSQRHGLVKPQDMGKSGHTSVGSPLRISELKPCVERGASWPRTAEPMNLTSFTGCQRGKCPEGGTPTWKIWSPP